MAQSIIDHVTSKCRSSTPDHGISEFARHVLRPLMMLETDQPSLYHNRSDLR